jgi:hypothetical protein
MVDHAEVYDVRSIVKNSSYERRAPVFIWCDMWDLGVQDLVRTEQNRTEQQYAHLEVGWDEKNMGKEARK